MFYLTNPHPNPLSILFEDPLTKIFFAFSLASDSSSRNSSLSPPFQRSSNYYRESSAADPRYPQPIRVSDHFVQFSFLIFCCFISHIIIQFMK